MFKRILLILVLSSVLIAEEPWVMILGYHRIVQKRQLHPDVTVSAFEEQLEFIKANYEVISLDYLVRCLKEKNPPTANSIVITLDDGDESIYTHAYPLLKKYNLPATVFYYSNYLGNGGITRAQIKEMSENGICFGSHTKTHALLTVKLKGESAEGYQKRLREELTESKKTIEEITKKEVKYLAYPYGKHNEVVDAEAVKAGYMAAVGIAWDRNYISSAAVMNLKRRLIPGRYKLSDFADIFKSSNIDKSLETDHEDYR